MPPSSLPAPDRLSSLPHPDMPGYDDVPQFPVKAPLPFRRTIRRQELHQIVPLAETTIYEMCQATPGIDPLATSGTDPLRGLMTG